MRSVALSETPFRMISVWERIDEEHYHVVGGVRRSRHDILLPSVARLFCERAISRYTGKWEGPTVRRGKDRRKLLGLLRNALVCLS
jgi:hypothetical protein